MVTTRPESDQSKAPTDTPVPGTDLYAQTMGGPKDPKKGGDHPPAPAAPSAPPTDQAAAKPAPPETIVVKLELTQTHHAEPAHLKVHRGFFGSIFHAVGEFGHQYLLGLRDSVEPRNLGRETLPIAVSLGSQLIIANQIRQGIKGGFNQVGGDLKSLGNGEAQLGANQAAIAHALALQQQEIAALAGAKGGALPASMAAHESAAAAIAPRVASGVTPEAAISMPLSAPPIMAAGDAPGITVASGGAASVLSGARVEGASTAVLAAAVAGASADGGSGVVDANASLQAPNVGLDVNGFAVPMTAKQLEAAKEYQASTAASESKFADAGTAFSASVGKVSDSMTVSPLAAAFINDLKMRYQYAVEYDRQGDHSDARAYLSDCRQDARNLGQMAENAHIAGAAATVDELTRNINALDDIEKHFRRRPDVVLATAPDQTSAQVAGAA